MFISDKLKIISVLFVFVVTFGTGFVTGQKVSGDYYRNEIKQIEIKSLQLENEYLIKKIDTQKELKNKVNEVLSYAENQKQDIDRAYTVSINRLQQPHGTSADKVSMSDNAGTYTRTKTSRGNQCHCDSRKNFKRLSEQLLNQAKEYDLLKVKYNSLLQIYQEAEQRINNFN